ncbi:MAG: hypothetical protein DA330_02380 [Nitrososphaera sp.]|nr:hypothetical protein [Nitrososphaera sp.]
MACLRFCCSYRIIFLSPVKTFVLRLSGRENEISNKDELTWIAGSVVLSDNPPQQLRYWRKKLAVKQADLAKKMSITASVLSDYEKGRRPSPGANFIKRYLQALYDLSQSNEKSRVETQIVPTPVISADAVQLNQT